MARPLLLIAHPGHEIRLHHWIELEKPHVCVLTDGSGGNAVSRMDASRAVIQETGSIPGPIFGTHTDKEFYSIIREGRAPELLSLAERLHRFIIRNDIRTVVADMLEGYNTSHDICCCLAGAVVEKHRRWHGAEIENLDFPLEGLPDRMLALEPENCRVFPLDDDAFIRKLAAARHYEQLRGEVDRAIETCGELPFRREVLRQAPRYSGLAWEKTDPPYYEIYGKKMVSEGRYTDLITYHQHIQPLARALWDWADEMEPLGTE